MGGEPHCHSDYRNNGHQTPKPRWLKTQWLAELGPVALPAVEEEMVFPPRALSTEGSSPSAMMLRLLLPTSESHLYQRLVLAWPLTQESAGRLSTRKAAPRQPPQPFM